MPLGQVAPGQKGHPGKPPPAGHTGGGMVLIPPGTSVQTPQQHAQQQSILGWLQGASGLNLSSYNSTLSSLGAQRNAAMGAYGSQVGAANRGYGLDIRGIDQDLMYGNQLRDEESHRNVDLGRQRATYDMWNANEIWRILQEDVSGRKAFNLRDLDINNRATNTQYDTGMRQVGSDAIARGARTAAGTLASFGDVRTGRDQNLQRHRLGWETNEHGFNTELQRGSTANQYARASYGIDMETFDSIARTYGIQAAQAVAQAALARDKAAASRDSSVSSAAAGRGQALAGLAGAQSSAYNQYIQQQMALMQQMYGL